MGLVLASLSSVRGDDPASEEFFEKRVRPTLAGVCFRCHGGQKTAGGLRVDSRESLVQGGESGSALDLTTPDRSLLLLAIQRAEGVSAMPPDKPLAERAVADLKAWIKASAPWPKQTDKFSVEKHWAFQPLQSTMNPAVQDVAWPRDTVDNYILASLEAAGQNPSPATDRRTWLRRVTYDLTGLPPTWEELQAFLKDDTNQAFEKVVDRLLASPAYGEHWGRHWLDVVRYADTAGENSDHPLPHAWRYRNWVIEALNRDLPYDQFLREQIAGDLLAAQSPPQVAHQQIVATGYLAIARRFGHDIDKDMHLTMEDTLDTLGKSVLGLSLGCCRCHDHKFDPLTVQDYYGLYGIFASTRFPFPGCEPQQQPRDLVALPMSPEASEKYRQIEEKLAEVERELKDDLAAEAVSSTACSELLAKHAHLLAAGEIDDGKEGLLGEETNKSLHKVAVKVGETLLLSISPRGNHGADSTRLELEIKELGGQQRAWNLAQLLDNLAANNPHADELGNDGVWAFLDLQNGIKLLPERLSEISGRKELQAWRNGDTPSVFVNRHTEPVKVWTELPARSFFAHPGPQGAVGLAWKSSVDGEISIQGKVADAHPGGPDGVAWKLEHIAAPDFSASLHALGQALGRSRSAAAKKAELIALRPVAPLAYAVQEGESKNARIQLRGEPAELGDETPRKFLDVLGGRQLEPGSGSGRLELAQWLTDPANPLTPRVIVNRIWYGHFGRGLVSTPNDFGTRGTSPTHPELLDRLALDFVASGWRFKPLHRRLVLSATYRQAAGETALATNYAAFQRRRLSAEEIRDTLLVAGGDLDPVPGGAHPFPPESSWSFTQHAPFAAEYPTLKRSVYVMQKRNRRDRFFALFDGADPNSSTPTRDVTTVPTQALFFMNDPLVHAQAEKFAARVLAAQADDRLRVEFAWQHIVGRHPTPEEQEEAAAFLRKYVEALSAKPEAERQQLAWRAYARVLLSSNEVLHVD